jgi:hypothetical protein
MQRKRVPFADSIFALAVYIIKSRSYGNKNLILDPPGTLVQSNRAWQVSNHNPGTTLSKNPNTSLPISIVI